MQFIIGLGNPGKEYETTRHNIGWVVLEALARELQARPWQSNAKFKGEVAQAGQRWLLKPHTFMNASGLAARALIQFYDKQVLTQPALRSVWVIHDDLDLELGAYKIQLGRGPKVHNGLISLYQELGTQQFWHVRVGVDGRGGQRTMPGSEYVLQAFSAQEQEQLSTLTQEVVADLVARLQVE